MKITKLTAAFLKLLTLSIVLIIIGAFSSCRTITNTEYIHTHDTLRITSLQRDSILLHDSIFEKVEILGDTVKIYKYAEKLAYRDRILHDTIVKKEVQTKEVCTTITEKPPLRKQIATFFYGFLGALVLGLALVFALRSRLKHPSHTSS